MKQLLGDEWGVNMIRFLTYHPRNAFDAANFP